jgi:ankyrin repeat protein
VHRTIGVMLLLTLFRAIASGDRARAAQLLSETPLLAREALVVGASRESPNPYFFARISHHVYAGDTALHVAAAAYELQLTEALLSHGANPSARNRRGAEPLHYAADGVPGSGAWNPDAQAGVMRLLIGAGANPNSTDKSGVAPLHRAVRTRCAAAVRVLLDNGADPKGKNKSGSTPLHLAKQNTGRGNSGSAESREQQQAIIQLLLSRGAAKDDAGDESV